MIRMVIGMKYVPVIPCYNPPEVFSNIILELSQMGVRDVIIIDDGSNNKRIFSIANKKDTRTKIMRETARYAETMQGSLEIKTKRQLSFYINRWI